MKKSYVLHYHLRTPGLGQTQSLQLGQIPAFRDGNWFFPKFRRRAGPIAASLSASEGSCIPSPAPAMPEPQSLQSCVCTSQPRRPALYCLVVTATREVLTPNPARPRPSRSPAQHGDRQPGSGAAAARRELGAASLARPHPVLLPGPRVLPAPIQDGDFRSLRPGLRHSRGRSRGKAAWAEGARPRWPLTVRISRVEGGAGPHGAEAWPQGRQPWDGGDTRRPAARRPGLRGQVMWTPVLLRKKGTPAAALRNLGAAPTPQLAKVPLRMQ
ncbi:hypothetical protein HispidOSU_009931 [Sigmodon hispidus]